MAINGLFDQIMMEHGALIRRIAASYEVQQGLAEDLAQEIHLAVWRALPSFRGDSSLRTFVARIAMNRGVTHALRSRNKPESQQLSEHLVMPGDSPEASAIATSRQARLLKGVRLLPLAYRQPVMLTLEGMTPKEIAEVLGISANAAAIRLSRAKEMLRQYMGE
jgi:RNA polymerase sigma-70 factor (ECF subfamily)